MGHGEHSAPLEFRICVLSPKLSCHPVNHRFRPKLKLYGRVTLVWLPTGDPHHFSSPTTHRRRTCERSCLVRRKSTLSTSAPRRLDIVSRVRYDCWPRYIKRAGCTGCTQGENRVQGKRRKTHSVAVQRPGTICAKINCRLNQRVPATIRLSLRRRGLYPTGSKVVRDCHCCTVIYEYCGVFSRDTTVRTGEIAHGSETALGPLAVK